MSAFNNSSYCGSVHTDGMDTAPTLGMDLKLALDEHRDQLEVDMLNAQGLPSYYYKMLQEQSDRSLLTWKACNPDNQATGSTFELRTGMYGYIEQPVDNDRPTKYKTSIPPQYKQGATTTRNAKKHAAALKTRNDVISKRQRTLD